MRAGPFRPILIVAAVCAVAATAAFLLLPRPERPIAPVVPEKIRIANIGLYSNYNIIAERLGFFAAEGLDVELVEYDSGATSMDALKTGKADVAVAASFVGVRRIFADNELRILATVSSHDVFRVLARRDRGVGKPSDLRGRKIGVTLTTAGEFYLGKFLSANGLKRSEIEVVDLSASEIGAGILDGSIDAAMVFDPNARRLQQALAGAAVTWSAQGNRRELATVYARQPFIAGHPEAVERYMRALVEAERWQAAHEDEAKTLLAGALGERGADVELLWPEFDFGIRLDQEMFVTMEDQARWNIANGLVDAARVPNYLPYVHYAPLEKAKPSGVTIVHQR